MRKQRIFRITLILGSFVFAVGALGALSNGNWLLGFPLALGATANLLALLFLKRFNRSLDALLLFINAITCAITAVQTQAEGAQYLPYAWMLAALISLGAGIYVFVKFIKERMSR